MANELEVELLEVEILESKIRRLESSNEQQRQENERLSSTVSDLQTTRTRLLGENDRLRSTVSSLEEELEINHIKALETLKKENLLLKRDLDVVSGDLDAENDRVAQLQEEIEELVKNSVEDGKKTRRMREEKEALSLEIETLERRMDRIVEENTAVILAVIEGQSDLEESLKKQTEIIRGFFERTVKKVRGTVEMLERGGGMHGWDEGVGIDGGGGMDSTVEMMMRSIDMELAGVTRAFRRNLMKMTGGGRGREEEDEEEAGTA